MSYQFRKLPRNAVPSDTVGTHSRAFSAYGGGRPSIKASEGESPPHRRTDKSAGVPRSPFIWLAAFALLAGMVPPSLSQAAPPAPPANAGQEFGELARCFAEEVNVHYGIIVALAEKNPGKQPAEYSHGDRMLYINSSATFRAQDKVMKPRLLAAAARAGLPDFDSNFPPMLYRLYKGIKDSQKAAKGEAWRRCPAATRKQLACTGDDRDNEADRDFC